MTNATKSSVRIKKALCVVCAIVFLLLAFTMGIQTLQAWQSHTPLPNWKGGTMRCRDGCQLAFTLACIAGAWCYFAWKPDSGKSLM